MGAPPDKEYDECFEFATLAIVGENVQFTLAMRPRQKGERYGTVVRNLLTKAKQYVHIGTVYADAAFAGVDVIHALDQHRVKYVIPKPDDPRVKRFIDQMDHDVAVKHDHTMYGKTQGGSTNTPGTTTLVTVPSNHDEEKSVAFITNKDVHNKLSVERE